MAEVAVLEEGVSNTGLSITGMSNTGMSTTLNSVRNLESAETLSSRPKGKGRHNPYDKKKHAKDIAAEREQLLSSRNPAYVISYLERKTHFDRDQIRALQKIHQIFKGSFKMDRLRFREMVASLLGITDNMMLDRIFQAFDGSNEGEVSDAEWIIGLSVLLRGSLDQVCSAQSHWIY